MSALETKMDVQTTINENGRWDVQELPDDQQKLTVSRRGFVQVLGAGLVISVTPIIAEAQPASRPAGQRGGGRGGEAPAANTLGTRLHIAKDGSITAFCGKIEMGQGARAETTLAVAEEMRVPLSQVTMVLGDTDLCPSDGQTAGSGTTPGAIPKMRQAGAAARELLTKYAAGKWGVDAGKLVVKDGKIASPDGKSSLGYGDLASDQDQAKQLAGTSLNGAAVTPVAELTLLGSTAPRPNGRDIVTGRHQYPTDIQRPGMLYGCVLRPASYKAKLSSVDTSAAKAMPGVQVVEENGFVAVAAPSQFVAEQAIAAIAKTAKWDEPGSYPTSDKLQEYLREHAKGGVPKNPFEAEYNAAPKKLARQYRVPYIQHAALEPMVGVAEWTGGDKVTIWTGNQNPFGVRSEIANGMKVDQSNVHIIVPDFGGAFGGKQNAGPALEAARIAKAVGKPVIVRHSRKEEFTWAWFRAGSAIDIQASLDDKGNITTWWMTNINHGPQGMEMLYKAGKDKSQYVASDAVFRHGSYRALAATPNTFAREAFIDELAAMAGEDPVAFRLARLDEKYSKIHRALKTAADKFGWADKVKNKQPGVGYGCAVGTDKGSFVACIAQVQIKDGEIQVTHVTQAFDNGKVLNEAGLLSQMQGGIVMGLGPALREEIMFENGVITNASFLKYEPPRFGDVPKVEAIFIDKPNSENAPSTGAGETPMIGIAGAIANAVFNATGKPVHALPIKAPTA